MLLEDFFLLGMCNAIRIVSVTADWNNFRKHYLMENSRLLTYASFNCDAVLTLAQLQRDIYNLPLLRSIMKK